MTELPPTVNLLLDIETRQDEVLRQLAELEQRLERVLAECASFCRPGAELPAPGNTATVPMVAAKPAAAASVAAVKVA